MSVQALTWVLEHSVAEHGARLVAISLANHAGTDGSQAYPSIPTIAREARLGESTVRDAIRQLIELGELEEIGLSRYRTRVFRFPMNPPETAPPQNLDPRRIEQPTPQNLAPDPAESAGEPSVTVPQPETNPPAPRKRGERRTSARPSQPDSQRKRDHDRHRQAVSDWLGRVEPPADADTARWQAARDLLRATVPEHAFAVWIEPLRLAGCIDGELVLTAPEELVSWIDERFGAAIRGALDGHPFQIVLSDFDHPGAGAQERPAT